MKCSVADPGIASIDRGKHIFSRKYFFLSPSIILWKNLLNSISAIPELLDPIEGRVTWSIIHDFPLIRHWNVKWALNTYFAVIWYDNAFLAVLIMCKKKQYTLENSNKTMGLRRPICSCHTNYSFSLFNSTCATREIRQSMSVPIELNITNWSSNI